MYLAKTYRKDAEGKPLTYWILRETRWDREERRSKNHYLAYVGPSRRITLKRASELAAKLGCSIEELERVKHLRIIENGKASA